MPSGNGKVYYGQDALLGGFDWFQTLTGWFPQVLGSSAALSPGGRVVDMAYAVHGTMTFSNVVVPASGLYTVDWRYGAQTIPVSGSGRYVRMYGTQRATQYGYSLWEFQVFGCCIASMNVRSLVRARPGQGISAQ